MARLAGVGVADIRGSTVEIDRTLAGKTSFEGAMGIYEAAGKDSTRCTVVGKR
jgi:hypothetical protein